jgi:DNA helicase II / ATP-dependent DNA helicase PcrA
MKDAVSRGQPIWEVLRGAGPPAGLAAPRGAGVSPANSRGAGVPPAALPANAREAVTKFTALIDRYHNESQQAKSLVDLVRRLLAEIGYEKELQRQYNDPNEQQARWQSVEEVVNALGIYEKGAKKASLGGFIDEVTLGQQDMGDEKDKQLSKNAVALLTMHAAKGLEFPHVYLVGLEEGILPHHRSLKAEGGDDVAEERRLCYVGITRAQERLTLSLSLTRMKWGKPRDTIPSRFLYEIMGQAEKAPGGRRGATPPPHRSPAPAARRRQA